MTGVALVTRKITYDYPVVDLMTLFDMGAGYLGFLDSLCAEEKAALAQVTSILTDYYGNSETIIVTLCLTGYGIVKAQAIPYADDAAEDFAVDFLGSDRSTTLPQGGQVGDLDGLVLEIARKVAAGSAAAR